MFSGDRKGTIKERGRRGGNNEEKRRYSERRKRCRAGGGGGGGAFPPSAALTLLLPPPPGLVQEPASKVAEARAQPAAGPVQGRLRAAV